MSINPDTLKNIVEAAILAAETPLEMRQILALFPIDASPEREEIQAAIDTLQADCENRGIELRKIGKAWRFQTREQLAPWLRKLNEGRPPRYSRAMLETLAIIAYRQPVTRGDIEEVRGVAVSSDTMRVMQERDWIKQVGVRDVPGHPALYGTTPGFLGYFNLESLKELPALIEQRDIETIAREQNIQIPIVTDMDDGSGLDIETDTMEQSSPDQSDSDEADRTRSPEEIGAAGETTSPPVDRSDGDIENTMTDAGDPEVVESGDEDEDHDETGESMGKRSESDS